MSEASFFKTLLSELDQTDSKELPETSDKLNSLRPFSVGTLFDVTFFCLV